MDAAHNEDSDREAIAAAATILDHNVIDTTSLNDVLGRLPLFLSTKSVLVVMVEEAGHILLLSAKYHAKAAGDFLFSIFFPRF